MWNFLPVFASFIWLSCTTCLPILDFTFIFYTYLEKTCNLLVQVWGATPGSASHNLLGGGRDGFQFWVHCPLSSWWHSEMHGVERYLSVVHTHSKTAGKERMTLGFAWTSTSKPGTSDKLLWGLFFFMVHWSPVQEKKGAEAVTKRFVQPVNTEGIPFWEKASVRQHNFISEWGEV